MEELGEIKNVKITEFANRHFKKNFGGTKILDISVEDFERDINTELYCYYSLKEGRNIVKELKTSVVKILPGYADFCKIIILKNRTNAKTGSLPITLENYQYIRSGYSFRVDGELPVLSRWLELPCKTPKAEYLSVIMYSKEQIEKEATADFLFNGDWGIVAILGQMHDNEEPMKPETMLRNYMPIEFGGSGMEFPIKPNTSKYDLEDISKAIEKYNIEMDNFKKTYQVCVDFWNKNVTVK